MASFTLSSGLYTTQQTLTGGQYGILSVQTSQLVVALDAIVSTGATENELILNGFVAATLPGANAIDASGQGLRLQVGPNGYLSALDGEAIRVNVDSTFYMNNAGTIQSDSSAILAFDTDGNAFMYMANSGVIQSRRYALQVDSGTGSNIIVNSGTLMSSSITAVLQNYSSGSTGTAYFNNTGEVIGVTTSYSASVGLGANILSNSGRMVGNVELGAGNDRYEGPAGVVNGSIRGEDGNDTLSGGLNADQMQGGDDDDLLVGRGGDDSLFGEFGNDMQLGGDGNDLLDGGSGDDTLIGNGGDDSLDGGSNDDLLLGQDGSDSLDGSDGSDTLDGGAGDDILEGGAGNDILRGRAGEDDLAGGEGLDYLTGGQGADSFVFRSIAEAGLGAARDQILDFEQGTDLIVVAGLSPGVFEFIGTNAFAPSGNPELRLFETPTGSTIVQMDNNGDGVIDAEIRVANVTGLTAQDFVL